jgi:hypothetical protein
MFLEAVVEAVAGSLPLERLPLSRRDVTNSSRGMAPASEHHEPKTVAARTDSSESECRILDTVRPPREKARSASVEVAAK